MSLNKCKYVKASQSLLDKVVGDDHLYASFNGTYWICRTCDSALSRGQMPVQSIANNLELSPIPSELSCLYPLETRLVCLRVPFMKMAALPSGKQRCIHGPAVDVPSKLDSVVTTLPRLPTQSELIPLKFKRKLAYKGHYMYDFVTPEKILDALRWLKANHPQYADVELNEELSQVSENIDFDLHAGFMKSTVETDDPDSLIDSNQSVATTTLGTCTVDIIQDTPVNTMSVDNTALNSVCSTLKCDTVATAVSHLNACVSSHSLVIHDVPGDGNCLFCFVLYQLETNDICCATVDDLGHRKSQ